VNTDSPTRATHSLIYFFRLLASEQGCNETLPREPSVTYTDLEVDYSNGALALNSSGYPTVPNAWMDFGFNIDDPDITYAAILYDDPVCQGNIIGNTSNALFSTAYVADPTKVQNLIKLEIDATSPAPGTAIAPRLNIYAHPKTFKDEFYDQDALCSNLLGEKDPPPDYNNPTTSKCGLFEGCVEFQALHCGNKADFVDVQMQVEFDLLERCEDDFCGEIRFVRDPVLSDGEDTEIGQVFCYPCERTGPDIPFIVSQGAAVQLCVDVSDNRRLAICL
jgi:hypothetical protein